MISIPIVSSAGVCRGFLGTQQVTEQDLTEINFALHDIENRPEDRLQRRAGEWFDWDVYQHIARRHWDGHRYSWESRPIVFNHHLFRDSFEVLLEQIVATIQAVTDAGNQPLWIEVVRGQRCGAFQMQLAGPVLTRVIINITTKKIITAFPVNH